MRRVAGLVTVTVTVAAAAMSATVLAAGGAAMFALPAVATTARPAPTALRTPKSTMPVGFRLVQFRPAQLGDGIVARGRGGHGDGAMVPHEDAAGWTAQIVPGKPYLQEQTARDLTAAFRAVTSDRVFFAEGSVRLGTRARAVVSDQARWLVANPDVGVAVDGHADDPGDAAENMALATRRAEEVRAALVAAGVGEERIAVVGWGRQDRVADCEDTACAAQNRRAVTRVGLPARLNDRRPPGKPGGQDLAR